MAKKFIQIRPMTVADIPLAMRLKSMANWNQLEADWQLLLSAEASGNFIASYQGKDMGTTTTFSYQDHFSWIGMVLVDPVCRGLGMGTFLLQTAISFAQTKGTVRLDATPQGKKLYETMGFVSERELLRLERKANSQNPGSPTLCTPVSSAIIAQLIAFDTPVFGANREKVITHLFQRNPEYAFFTRKNGKISGFCLGRSGSNFEQIGPIVAESIEVAQHLLLSSLAHCHNKPVIMDTFTQHEEWLDFLHQLGFRVQRPFTRMYLGELTHPGTPDLQYAITGPELG